MRATSRSWERYKRIWAFNEIVVFRRPLLVTQISTRDRSGPDFTTEKEGARWCRWSSKLEAHFSIVQQRRRFSDKSAFLFLYRVFSLSLIFFSNCRKGPFFAPKLLPEWQQEMAMRAQATLRPLKIENLPHSHRNYSARVPVFECERWIDPGRRWYPFDIRSLGWNRSASRGVPPLPGCEIFDWYDAVYRCDSTGVVL